MVKIKAPVDNTKYENKVLFYGFDRIGFEYIYPITNETSFKIEFCSYDSNVNLDKYDGLVVPSGIFESIKVKSGIGGSYNDIKFDRAKLLDVEKKVMTFAQEGGWVCFLVGSMIDEVSDGLYGVEDVSELDLAKKVLSILSRRKCHYDGAAHTKSKSIEFDTYVKKYGVAHTQFFIDEHTSLVEIGGVCFGFEAFNKIFALPFHTSDFSKNTLEDVAFLIVNGVTKYRRKMDKSLPVWADKFIFSSEQKLLDEKETLLKSLEKINEAIDGYKGFKSILVTTGTVLENEVMNIFKSFFGFEVGTDDKKLDDFQLKIDGDIVVTGEVKGVKGSIKRSYVSQVDTNREEQGLGEDVKGLLVANCNNQFQSFEDRLNEVLPSNVKSYACKINVTIIRTIELLNLMNSLEGNSPEERRKFFLDKIMSHTGHVSVSSDGSISISKE